MVRAEEKERYFVTLTQKKAMKTKQALETLGLPRAHFSVLLDEYLDIINPVLDRLLEAKRTGNSLTAGEMLASVAKAWDDKQEKL